jgi:hypothetical protein
MIRDNSVPPFVEQLTESFTGYVIYGMMDLYSYYDQRAEEEESEPWGKHRGIMEQ